MTLIWFGIACGQRRIRLASLKLVQHNFLGYNCTVVARSEFSTQQTVDNGSTMQFVNADHFQVRQLYTRNILGLEKLKLHQSYVSQLYKDNKDEYVRRLTRYVDQGETQHLIQDDLINMIGLADSDNHLELIEKLVAIFASDQKFFTSGWGIAIMRLYYTMNQVDRANLSLRNEAEYGQLYNKKACYRIVMTMLFNAGRYQDVIEVYRLACRKLEPARDRSQHYLEISVLTFGAYAKLNTPEALIDANKLYADVHADIISGYLKMRVLSFVAHLHNNQDQPEKALMLISKSSFKNHVTIRELKTIALIKLNRYEEVICHILESLKQIERGDKLMLKDVYDTLNSSLNSIRNDRVHRQLKDTLFELKQNGLIAETTLESLIYTGINNQKNVHQQNPSKMANQMANRERRLRLKAKLAKIS